MKSPLRKRRTRQHVIADLSVNFVERQALLAGFVIDKVAHDYGIDLEIRTFNRRGEVEQGKIPVQVKATDRLTLDSGKSSVACRIKRADLLYWLAEPLPVILVAYDARKDTAYWLYVQAYFAGQTGFHLFAAGREVTVRIPTNQVLDANAIRAFARFRDRILLQLDKVTHGQD
jgi:hypothetical protein